MTLQTNLDLSFVFADFSKAYHQKMFVMLINHYMQDPMGNSSPLSEETQKKLIKGMKDHPSCFVLFAILNYKTIGLVTCFVNFSTFKAKPYLNIHDVVVLDGFRGSGTGRKLIEKCIDIAKERDYCKITLEVRDDNTKAMKLYKSLGFEESEPVMHFWTKPI